MTSSSPTVASLPPLAAQAEHLIELGIPELAGMRVEDLRTFAADSGRATGGDLLAVHPDRLSASAIAPLLRHDGKPGFVVTDMPDVDHFAPSAVDLPDAPLYVVNGLDRGDRLANWTPKEALPVLSEEGRSPLLLTEGMHWVLQQPTALERNHCFMTIGSRLRKANGTLDARTPALWISNGTGRDGRERRNAPKVGWCWWGNRHTWLGIASAESRRP
ncbi:DUF5701 family protein [Streptomyces sp. JJ38]|uniref:DUF5701 family protein n=1 Tax=Streptomyces sp. JJ38 TaxID=2738128 RepID=UPI00214C6773|nr:DUF5701 family protein [Streptomyces sp. JJ38]MBW1596403.1 hypothetical protein [Streptomyces sp. JJ38]